MSIFNDLEGDFSLGFGGDAGGSDSSWFSDIDWGGIADAAGSVLKSVAPAAAGAAAGYLAPKVLNQLSDGQFKDARNLIGQATSGLENVQGADLTDLIPNLKLQVMQGSMTPAQAQVALNNVVGQMDPATAQAFLQQSSQMSTVQSDQGSLQGQRAALSQLADIGDNQGLTEADRAQFAAVMNQQNANAAQQRAAQIQQLQMQGNAGSGTELAARLSGVQGAANANAAAGADVAKSAQARALAAIQAGLAGNANLNTQMFDQAAQKAKAQDVINQFNAQAQNTIAQQNAAMQQAANQQNFTTANQVAMANQQAQNAINEANAARQQQAGALNFSTANTIAGTNTGIQNKQAALPYEVALQSFQNRLEQEKVAAGSQLSGAKLMNEQGNIIAGASTAAAQNAANTANAAVNQPQQQPKQESQPWYKKALPVVGSILGGIFSDEDLKTNKQELTDAEVDQMMATLTGYKYRYKGPKTNPTQTGVMAQDMPQGSVVDTPAGKMIQKPEALSQALAILANQHQRIKKLEGTN